MRAARPVPGKSVSHEHLLAGQVRTLDLQMCACGGSIGKTTVVRKLQYCIPKGLAHVRYKVCQFHVEVSGIQPL